MASAIINHPNLHHPSSSSALSPTILRKPPIYASLSTSRMSFSKTLTVSSSTCVPYMCLTSLSSWNGLRKNGFSISKHFSKSEKRKKCKGKGVYASLFGVGAPEALVIGVVALLVFGPKGLAEVAKNLGKTLRSFQPTIRELQEVSREFKSTLEKEIGLDELKNPVQGSYTSNTVRPSTSQVPLDTLQNSELTIPSSTTTEDSQATTEDSQATTVTPGGNPDVFQATGTIPAPVEDSQETAATPAATSQDSQPMDEKANGSASGKAYTSEDLLRITEEQLKAAASQQQKEQPPSPTPSEKPESEI